MFLTMSLEPCLNINKRETNKPCTQRPPGILKLGVEHKQNQVIQAYFLSKALNKTPM